MAKSREYISYYAGIGSREAPKEITDLMTKIGAALEERGYILRSGGARGSDQAFAKNVSNDKKVIYSAEDADENSMKVASKVHYDWDGRSDIAKKLLGRNAKIILGDNLDSPVEMVIAWTPNESRSSGTNNAIKIAKEYRIPKIFNLNRENHRELLKNYLNLED